MFIIMTSRRLPLLLSLVLAACVDLGVYGRYLQGEASPYQEVTDTDQGYISNTLDTDYPLLDTEDFHHCGFQEPSRENILAMREEELARARGHRSLSVLSFVFCHLFPRSRHCRPRVNIPVYVHNINEWGGNGRMSNSDIRTMIRNANRQLTWTGFRLRLKRIRHIINNRYYNAAVSSSDEFDMMTDLKRGGVETLNVYLKRATDGARDFCGYAFLAKSAANVGVRDGVTVFSSCALDDKTFTHEIGK
jgi:hypothetical protein